MLKRSVNGQMDIYQDALQIIEIRTRKHEQYGDYLTHADVIDIFTRAQKWLYLRSENIRNRPDSAGPEVDLDLDISAEDDSSNVSDEEPLCELLTSSDESISLFFMHFGHTGKHELEPYFEHNQIMTIGDLSACDEELIQRDKITGKYYRRIVKAFESLIRHLVPKQNDHSTDLDNNGGISQPTAPQSTHNSIHSNDNDSASAMDEEPESKCEELDIKTNEDTTSNNMDNSSDCSDDDVLLNYHK